MFFCTSLSGYILVRFWKFFWDFKWLQIVLDAWRIDVQPDASSWRLMLPWQRGHFTANEQTAAKAMSEINRIIAIVAQAGALGSALPLPVKGCPR